MMGEAPLDRNEDPVVPVEGQGLQGVAEGFLWIAMQGIQPDLVRVGEDHPRHDEGPDLVLDHDVDELAPPEREKGKGVPDGRVVDGEDLRTMPDRLELDESHP